MKKLSILTILSILLLSISIYSHTTKQAAGTHQTASKEKLTTYDYIITSIDSEGIHGKSLFDNTGIYLTQDNVKGLNLSVKDSIRVSFPNDQWDVITSVQKLESK
jgi:hypothetical protein